MSGKTIEIYCDEHGNTGEHLLDPEQRVFTLASNDFSAQEATDLLAGLRTQSAAEVKFKTLRKTGAGRGKLLPWMFDPRLNGQRIAIFGIDKRFMALAKLFDLVMETLAHSAGIDLYEGGANIATANMLAGCLPTFCGETPTNAMLEAFVRLVRWRKPEDLEEYLRTGQALMDVCVDAETKEFLEPFFDRELVPEWLDNLPSYMMDPAIPSLFTITDAWGRRKVDRFEIVHDHSKPVLASEQLFSALVAHANEASHLVGYDRRTFLFPLRATRLRMGDSVAYPQLQIADVCSGLAAYWFRAELTQTHDDLSKAFVDAGGKSWIVGGIFRSEAVSPEDLGTPRGEGASPIDAFMERVARRNA